MKKNICTIICLISVMLFANSCGRLDADTAYIIKRPSLIEYPQHNNNSHFKIKSVSFKEDKNATTIELESKGSYEWETTYQYDDYICDSNNPDVKYYLTYAKGTKEFTIGSKYTIKCTYGGYLTFKFEQIPSSVTKIDLYLGNDDNGNKDLIIKDIILQ